MKTKTKTQDLNKEEQKLLAAFKKGKLTKAKDQRKHVERARIAAVATMMKTKHISIRLSEKDLIKIKQKALSSGIPYQTLIGSLIHQYADDKIQIAI